MKYVFEVEYEQGNGLIVHKSVKATYVTCNSPIVGFMRQERHRPPEYVFCVPLARLVSVRVSSVDYEQRTPAEALAEFRAAHKTQSPAKAVDGASIGGTRVTEYD